MAHQERCLELQDAPRVVVEAPTGGGKTWAGAAPLLDAAARGDGALFLYPTNALADDQVDSLASLLRRAGKVPGVVRPDGSVDDHDAHVLLLRIHAGWLDEAAGELRAKGRGQTLSRVLDRLPLKPLWVVTNPDTAYLLCTARYGLSPQLWSRFRALAALVLDEFHLYRGPTLVRALAVMELVEVLLGVGKLRVLSATLPPDLRSLLVDRLGFVSVRAEEAAEGPESRVVQHAVDLEVAAVTPAEANARLVAETVPLLDELRAEVAPGAVPLLVLKQSVLSAISLEEALVDAGLRAHEIGVYRGLSSRAIRSYDGKAVVVGTSALEVGVDFHTRRLLFEARSPASFAQRLGRLGRHAPGRALFLTDPRVKGALDRLGECDRPTLLATVGRVLQGDDDLVRFTTSPFGKAVVDSTFGALRAQGKRLGAPAAFEAAVAGAQDRLERALALTSFPPASLMSRAARTRLRDACGFRGGGGSVEVFDVLERDRRGDARLASYEVELSTFYRRAQFSGRTPKGRPVVAGYGKPRRLALSIGADVDVGLHAPSGEQLELRLDGAATEWDSLLRERPHLVGVFPGWVRDHVSWREDVFESSDQRVALLDDDALVAAFLYWERTRDAVGGW